MRDQDYTRESEAEQLERAAQRVDRETERHGTALPERIWLVRNAWTGGKAFALLESGPYPDAVAYRMVDPVAETEAKLNALSYYLSETELRALIPLAQLGRQALEVSRDGGSWDGSDIQEAALRAGAIQEVTRAEPCGEHCICAEVDSPPFRCYADTTATMVARNILDRLEARNVIPQAGTP